MEFIKVSILKRDDAMKRNETYWDLERTMFYYILSFNYEQYLVYNTINTFVAAKPARQKKVAEQSGNIIRRVVHSENNISIDRYRKDIARSKRAQHVDVSFCGLIAIYSLGRSW